VCSASHRERGLPAIVVGRYLNAVAHDRKRLRSAIDRDWRVSLWRVRAPPVFVCPLEDCLCVRARVYRLARWNCHGPHCPRIGAPQGPSELLHRCGHGGALSQSVCGLARLFHDRVMRVRTGQGTPPLLLSFPWCLGPVCAPVSFKGDQFKRNPWVQSRAHLGTCNFSPLRLLWYTVRAPFVHTGNRGRKVK